MKPDALDARLEVLEQGIAEAVAVEGCDGASKLIDCCDDILPVGSVGKIYRRWVQLRRQR